MARFWSQTRRKPSSTYPFLPLSLVRPFNLRSDRTDLIRKLETRGQLLVRVRLSSLLFFLSAPYAFSFLTFHCLTFVKMTRHVFLFFFFFFFFFSFLFFPRCSKLLFFLESEKNLDLEIRWSRTKRLLASRSVRRVIPTWAQSGNCREHETIRLLLHWRLSVSSSIICIFILTWKWKDNRVKNAVAMCFSIKRIFTRKYRKYIPLCSRNF